MVEGRYLYCIADSGKQTSLGKIGIEGSEVYTILYKDLCAVVHNCACEPYQSENSEVVKSWLMAHQKVVDATWRRFGTVLPLSFDTVIRGEEGTSPEENIKDWLKQDYEELKKKMERVKGKVEYGVQIFWDPKVIGDELVQTNEELKKLEQEIKSKSKGTAYMYKQKLEDVLKKEIEKKASQYFKDFYEKVKTQVDDIKVEKTKKTEGDKQMLLNLSCLVVKDKSLKLAEELEKINQRAEFSVRFTGPWPPYSFT